MTPATLLHLQSAERQLAKLSEMGRGHSASRDHAPGADAAMRAVGPALVPGLVQFRDQMIPYALAEQLYDWFVGVCRKARDDGDFDTQTAAYLASSELFVALTRADRLALAA